MASYRKIILVAGIALLLGACGSGETSSSATAKSGDKVQAVSNSVQTVARSPGEISSVKISSGMDDAEENEYGRMYLSSSDLELIDDDGSQLVGLRFALPIPQGAIITQANIKFTTDEVTTAATDLQIRAEAVDDASAFSSSDWNISSRASTVNIASWSPAQWNSVGESGAPQTSSDISAVIQEVVDRSGWEENNHLVLIISGSGVRTADSYDGDPEHSAILTYSYTYATGQTTSVKIASGMDDAEENEYGRMYLDSSDLELIDDDGSQLVGLRFALPLPQGAIITQANIKFTTDEVTTAATDLQIWAEAADDASAFSSSDWNLSSRPATANSANWVPAPWHSVGESGAAQTTSDLSAVIQEVVDRSGWAENNHLVLVVSGSGVRTAYAYDGAPESSAVLTLTYTSATQSHAPTISGTPDSEATEGSAYSFTPTASDPDGDSLVFSIANKPEWASFDVNTGSLAGTPSLGHVGNYDNITITVSDGKLAASLAPFSIAVSDSNSIPTITGTPVVSVAEAALYSYTPIASDADGDNLTFSINNMPTWASFDTATGNLRGTPGYNDAGSYSGIVISVSDGVANAALNPFSITVANTNRPPTISGTPAATVAENGSYSFTPAASDADGDSLTFNVTNLPVWASFNAASGHLSGTPNYSAAGTYGNIVISVSDGIGSTPLAAFSITVTNVNQAPEISGAPSSSVNAGADYDFTPNASDRDGDALTFSISSMPSWMTFDSATGRLAGTPQEADVGTYNGISISVSDGSQSISLAAFSITVQSSVVAKGSVTLNWIAPSTRTDGSALDLSEIGGYVVYLGTNSSDLSMRIEDLNDGSATSYVIEDLELDTYYVAISVYDLDGNESAYSNIIVKNVTN